MREDEKPTSRQPVPGMRVPAAAAAAGAAAGAAAAASTKIEIAGALEFFFR